jgi:lysophospholipase L1-like esterase
MDIVDQTSSFVMKHKMPIIFAIAAIAAIVLSIALKKKEKYYDYETTVIAKSPVPKAPAWVQGDPEKSPVFFRRRAGARNAAIAQTASSKKIKYDFVLYGDSITMIAADKHMDVWNKYFGQNGMKSAPLGVGGDTVQNLSWRVALGKERFAVPPKVVGLLIGINNLGKDNTDPVVFMDTFLLPYLKAVYPTSKFILIGLLPNTVGGNKNELRMIANRKYWALSKKYGMQYADISKGLVPTDKNQFFDGIHPTAGGYDIMYKNLKPYVMTALRNAK